MIEKVSLIYESKVLSKNLDIMNLNKSAQWDLDFWKFDLEKEPMIKKKLRLDLWKGLGWSKSLISIMKKSPTPHPHLDTIPVDHQDYKLPILTLQPYHTPTSQPQRSPHKTQKVAPSTTI